MKRTVVLHPLMLAAFLLSPLPARAGEVVVSEGELSLEDFYRAVACGAEPGGDCRTEILRWPKERRHNLQVHINTPEAGFPSDKAKMIAASVRLAVTEINVSGADIQLQVVDNPSAPIQVSMLDANYGKVIEGSGDPVLDGTRMRATAGALQLKPGTQDILKASMAVSAYIAKDLIRAAVLREVLKAIGLQDQIDNPFYVGKTVFIESTHDIYRVRRQDMLALRLHYPTNCAPSACF